MEFNLNNINEIYKIAQCVKRSGYYNCDEHYEDIAEKVAFLLATTNVLKEVETPSGLIKALVRDLNDSKQFRETFAQEANCSNYRRQRNAVCEGVSQDLLDQKKVTFFNIEACKYTDEEGNTCNPAEPEDKKSGAVKYKQHMLERRLWTYENLFVFFRDFLKRDFTRADISDRTRLSWKCQFNKTFKATWSKVGKGEHLILFKRSKNDFEPDYKNKHFGENAIFVADYIYQFDREVHKSDLWRQHLNRIKVGKHGDWCEKHRIRFDACLTQLSEIDRDKMQKWLNYEYKINSYDDLKLFNDVFLATGNDQFLKNVKVALRVDDFKDIEENYDWEDDLEGYYEAKEIFG